MSPENPARWRDFLLKFALWQGCFLSHTGRSPLTLTRQGDVTPQFAQEGVNYADFWVPATLN
jgi:hypothetical protein